MKDIAGIRIGASNKAALEVHKAIMDIITVSPALAEQGTKLKALEVLQGAASIGSCSISNCHVQFHVNKDEEEKDACEENIKEDE